MPCKREHVLNLQSMISVQDLKLSLLICTYISQNTYSDMYLKEYSLIMIILLLKEDVNSDCNHQFRNTEPLRSVTD